MEWAAEAARRGAGEILLTSMDRDWQDGSIWRSPVRWRVRLEIPVIASGGGDGKDAAEGIIIEGEVTRCWRRASSTSS